MAEKTGKVYLVGSGPGNSDYLTVRSQEIIAQAEVLVYDALVDSEIVAGIPNPCLKLDVGKRGGQPSTPQREINRLLVEHCQQGKTVVRLKNGDPFIFGRAQSEIDALTRENCAYEVIPGLSSALVAPLMAGIPLTDPTLSQCFTVLTAHDPDSLNWVSLSRMDTLVILMGGKTLPELVRRLEGHGRSPKTPIAIIRYASRSDQQIWIGTLATILDKTRGESLAPCVIVVGDVVKLRMPVKFEPEPQIQTQRQTQEQPQRQTRPTQRNQPPRNERIGRNQPLTNQSTQDQSAQDQSAQDQRDQDGWLPVSGYQLAMGGEELAIGFSAADPFDLPAFSSESNPSESNPSESNPSEPNPSESPSILIEAIAQPSEPSEPSEPLAGKRILITRAANQSSQFTQLLLEQGASVVEMPTLEIAPPSSWSDLDKAIARLDEFDWLILTSTNGVDYFFQRLQQQTGESSFSTNIRVAVVGEKTAQRLRKLGLQPDFIPPDYVADSLVSHFPEPLSGLRVLFPRVESGGREVLVKEFLSQGARVREVAAYESRCPRSVAPDVLAALQAHSIDIVTFASSKTVQYFCQLLEQANPGWKEWLEGLAIASIGPQTSSSCETLLGRVDIEAEEYTLEGLTRAIVQKIELQKVELQKIEMQKEKTKFKDSIATTPETIVLETESASSPNAIPHSSEKDEES